jgi:hypothetical protein
MKMKKRDISLTGKIQHQKDIGYNLMDKYLGALAELADVKPEVSMNIKELEKLARAATPGEWSHSRQIGEPLHCSLAQVWSNHGISLAWIESTHNPEESSNTAAYIAAANPQTVLKLCEVIRLQHEALDAMEVSANTVGFCYSHRPENFASALQKLKENAEQARAALAKANEVLGGE